MTARRNDANVRHMTEFQTTARAATAAMRSLFPATPLLRNDHLSAKYGTKSVARFMR